MKQIFMMLLMACANVAMAAGTVVVKSVEAHQRYPWNGLVDVIVTIEGLADDMAVSECTFVSTNSATGASVPIITWKGPDSGSGTTWMRSFVWNAANDVGAVEIDDLALTVDVKELDGVQLWENGPYWAKCNIGASKPEESGYYFWWGDTVGYRRNASNNGWVSVKDGSGFSFSSGNCPTYNKDNSALRSMGYIDSTGNLVASHDAATAYLGAPWRMPTDAEFSALTNNCDTTWTMHDGVYGCLVTGRGSYASKSIFLPAAGRGEDSRLVGSDGMYWSSTPNSDGLNYAWRIYFYSIRSIRFYRNYRTRYDGQTIRPVREFAK